MNEESQQQVEPMRLNITHQIIDGHPDLDLCCALATAMRAYEGLLTPRQFQSAIKWFVATYQEEDPKL